jgi:quercetin dioxygenase-like cupin family protein
MVRHESETKAIDMSAPGAAGSSMKSLIGPEEGWKDHVMRQVELAPDGSSPHHQHPWPHINYVLEGEGALLLGDQETPIRAGDTAFVPSDTLHQYRNKGDKPLKFLCIVPKEGHIL